MLRRVLLLREGPIIVVTVLAFLYFAITTSTFVTSSSFKNLLPFFAPYAIVAAGEVFLMINAEIDLSIGGTYLISPYLFQTYHNAGIPLILALVLAILSCSAVGLINGYLVAVIGITSFVTTLGTLFALFGFTLVLSHGQQINTPGTTILGNSTFEKIFGGGTYSELVWAIAIVVVLQLALTFTKWGIYTVAVGGNRLGAKEAGINEKINLIRNFMVCATLAGFTGLLEAIRVSTATPDSAGPSAFLFQAISAAVIGGTLLVGGFGTVVGAFIGALFFGIVQDGLVLKGVNGNYTQLFVGLAILVAMIINVYVARARQGRSRG